MEEIDFTSDTFDDIVAKDPRFNARAYGSRSLRTLNRS